MIAKIAVHSKLIILATVGGNIKVLQSLPDMPITVVFFVTIESRHPVSALLCHNPICNILLYLGCGNSALYCAFYRTSNYGR